MASDHPRLVGAGRQFVGESTSLQPARRAWDDGLDVARARAGCFSALLAHEHFSVKRTTHPAQSPHMGCGQRRGSRGANVAPPHGSGQGELAAGSETFMVSSFAVGRVPQATCRPA